MFKRRKKSEPGQIERIADVIEYLAELEPRQMDRVIALAKEKRAYQQKVDTFAKTTAVLKSKPEELELDFEETK